MTDDLDRYLATLSDQIADGLSDVIHAQAVRLSDAQSHALQALEQPPEETGDLEASCVVVPGENDLEWLVQAGGDEIAARALAFEFGTSRQLARPWFYPTYNAMRDQMQSAISDAIDEALKK